jgi:hypothetical protein
MIPTPSLQTEAKGMEVARSVPPFCDVGDCLIEVYAEDEQQRPIGSIPICFDISPTPPSPLWITRSDEPEKLPPVEYQQKNSPEEKGKVDQASDDKEGQREEAKEENQFCSEPRDETPLCVDEETMLELDQEMFATLFEMGFPEAQIRHALKRCNSITAAVQMLNPDQGESASASHRWPCPICLDDYPLSEMITLDCLHRLCLDCFKSYCESKINENEVLSDQLCCPILVPPSSSSSSVGSGSKMCGHPITVHEIKANIDETVFEKYERFVTRSFCEDQKLTSCPKCNEWYVDLQEVLHLEHTWKEIKCQKCAHSFCGKCGQVPHKAQYDQDVDCETYAKWLESNSKTDDNFLAYVENNKLFSCPKCKMYGVLESGCKFMYCRCKENYCALCGQKLTERDHFNHFTGVPGATGPMGNVCVGMEGVPRKGKAKKAGKDQDPLVPPAVVDDNLPRTRGRGRPRAVAVEEVEEEEAEVEERRGGRKKRRRG